MSRYIKLADALRTLSDTCYLDEIDENMQRLPSIDIVLCSACRFGDDHYMHSEDSHRFEWCYEFNDVDGYCPFGKKRSGREDER